MRTASTTSTTGVEPDVGAGPEIHEPASPARHLVVVLLAAVVVAGVVLRLWTTSGLWLDEALSVNIARLPVDDLLEALRRDGHPPLYYLLLHGWMEVTGTSDVAVRALSAVFGVLALPLIWPAARRLGGRPAAVAALALLASSPYAVRYATEARMYSLVMLLVLAGWLAVHRALDGPEVWPLVATALVTGALLLTHYWAFYLLAVTGGLLLWEALRGTRREAARRLLAAMAVGSLLFLPWLPAFLDQAGSTGTPWGRPERPAAVTMISLTDFGGGPYGEGQVLGLALALLVLLGVLGRALDSRRIELDLRTRPESRPAAIVLVGTMALGVVVGFATASAYASRYAAIVYPLFLLLAALGLTRLTRPALRHGLLALLVLVGIYGGTRNLLTSRTQAGDVAEAVDANGEPGDVVAYCPDQLGPAVTRELGDGYTELTYPDLAPPERVDWVDYAERMRSSDPVAFAEALLERAEGRTIWLVWAQEYRTLEERCETVAHHLSQTRLGGNSDAALVIESGDEFEHAWLFRFPG